jgi:hypothetical protein
MISKNNSIEGVNVAGSPIGQADGTTALKRKDPNNNRKL